MTSKFDEITKFGCFKLKIVKYYGCQSFKGRNAYMPASYFQYILKLAKDYAGMTFQMHRLWCIKTKQKSIAHTEKKFSFHMDMGT